MKINNGERVHRNRYTTIPMPEDVVDKVHRLAKRQKFLKEGIEFRDRRNELIDNVDDDTNINRNTTGVEGTSETEPETDTDKTSSDDDNQDDPSDDEEDDPDYDNSDDDDDGDSSDGENRPGLQQRGGDSSDKDDNGDDYDGMQPLQERAREDSSSDDDDGPPDEPESPPVDVAPTSPSR